MSNKKSAIQKSEEEKANKKKQANGDPKDPIRKINPKSTRTNLTSSSLNIPISANNSAQDLHQQLSDMKITQKLIIKANGTSYECTKVVGNGSFGVVYQATEIGRDKKTYNGQVVAIKRVLQDRRYKNRELQIMKMLHHTNVVNLLNSFYEHEKQEVYLNLVLDFMPQNLYKYSRQFSKQKKPMPVLQVQLYIYQLCRALAYIHSVGICHRDIKPQNLLIDPKTHQLKLCDFGSAKMLVEGEPNVAYICSRYYRAPELCFGATSYTMAIDVWSTGCVMAELLLGQPIFPGESSVDQLIEIIKVLGTPTKEQIFSMNPNTKETKYSPAVKPHPWNKVFPSHVSTSCIDLVSSMLKYTPTERCTPLKACAHEFFDPLRLSDAKLQSSFPPLFNFTPEEMTLIQQQNLASSLVPANGRNNV